MYCTSIQESILEEMNLTVKKRLTDGVISSSRNAADHIYFGLNKAVIYEIKCIYKAKKIIWY